MTRHLARLGASAALALVPFLLALPTLAAPALDDPAPTPSAPSPILTGATTSAPPAATSPPSTAIGSDTPETTLASSEATPTDRPPIDPPEEPATSFSPLPPSPTTSSSAEGEPPTYVPTDDLTAPSITFPASIFPGTATMATPSPDLTDNPTASSIPSTHSIPPGASATETHGLVLTDTVTPTLLAEDGSTQISPTLPANTPTLTETETPTPTMTPSPTLELLVAPPAAPSFGLGTVLINEVAWAGTDASPNDEWIELWNPGPEPIDLTDWTLTDGGDIRVSLSGEVAAFGFYLLERTDDATVSDMPADRIYTGSLNNGGESLELLDPSDSLIDTANAPGGAWPAGSTSPRASMERHSLVDLPSSWTTFPGLGGNGLDARGNPIRGTPRQPNAPSSPATATATPTPTEGPADPYAPGTVLINEVAWAGTIASGNDEWIELYNPGDASIDLDGWRLTDDGDIDIVLDTILDAGGYYLLERTDDTTVADLRADRIYTGVLSNGGEALFLLDPTGTQIDVVNPGGGPWPAGDASRHASMERGGAWRTFAGYFGRGLDADGNPIRGTPGGPNSILLPTPMPTWIPGRVVINELLIRPRYDWEGTGGVTTADEFIELYNRGPGPVNLRGWTLDDVVVGGSTPYELPSMTIEPGAYAVLFRSRTRIALNDSGDSVRLAAPDGSLVDKVRYLRIRAANLSFGRLPDGDENLAYGLWPTPGEPNELFAPRSFPPGTILINEIAWAGSPASANHEWIELWNPGHQPVNLFGWTLTDDGDIEVHLSGVIEAGGYALLERSTDQAVPRIPGDVFYTGSLANDGERLRLLDPSGAEVDVANAEAGPWPAGDASTHASMERGGREWATFIGPSDTGTLGTPRSPNRATAGEGPAGDGSCPGAGACP